MVLTACIYVYIYIYMDTWIYVYSGISIQTLYVLRSRGIHFQGFYFLRWTIPALSVWCSLPSEVHVTLVDVQDLFHTLSAIDNDFPCKYMG